MNRIIAGTFLAILLFWSCSSNNMGDKLCDLFEEATEKVEKATSLKQIENINNRLIQDIGTYSLSITQEVYDNYNNDSEATKNVEEKKAAYTKAKQDKEKQLTP